MNCVKRLLIILGILGNIVYSQSQEWKVFTTENSDIPGTYINAIELDQQNNIWIGTADGGLARFDGQEWKIYNTSNSGLPENDIFALAVDFENSLWIGTFSKGLVRFSDGEWHVFNTSNSPLPSNNVIALGIDNQGHVWVGTFPYFGTPDIGGAAEYDSTNWTVYTTENSGLPHNMVTAFAFDEQNNVWMAAGNRYVLGQGGGVVKFNGTTWETVSIANLGLPWDFVHDIAIDASQKIYFATEAGLAILDGQNWTTYNHQNSDLPHTTLKCLDIENNDTVWIGSGWTRQGGLVKYENGTMEIFDTSNSELPGNDVWAIKISSNGDKLIGTHGDRQGEGGFAIYNKNGIKTDMNASVTSIPNAIKLIQNYPNPFNPLTTISFELPQDGFVTINIYDLTRRRVRTLVQSQHLAGIHSIQWNGTDDTGHKVAAGIYFYKIEFTNALGEEMVLTKKMSLVK